MKTTASSNVFAVSDHFQPILRRGSLLRVPAVSEAGIAFDVVETGVALAELLADAVSEGMDIGTIASPSLAGEEAFAVDGIVDLPVADILSRLLGPQSDNFEYS
jgi:hypothetical protein